MEAFFVQLPWGLNLDLILRILDSKFFSAIYWGAAAVVAVVGLIAKIKYRQRNLKRFLDAYLEKASKAEGKERASVKEVIARAIQKARGIAPQGRVVPFDPSNVFEEAARLCAQRQPDLAIKLLRDEAGACETTIDYAKQQVRAAQERAATAYLEIGSILRHQERGLEAINAFMDMLGVNPGDLDALRMLGIQYRDLGHYVDAEQNFTALLHYVAQDRVAAADVKRELGAVFLGSREYGRAEAHLNEAMAIERELQSQRGIALTHESIGTVRTARRQWKLARQSYDASKKIFDALRDTQSVRHVEQLIEQMEKARDGELRQRRERRARRRASAHAPEQALTLH